MCLGIPGKVVELASDDGQLAWVDICGVRREVNIALVMDGIDRQQLIGTWVLVHVGFAMSRIDEEEAQATLDVLRQMEELEQDVTFFLRQ
ncbi:hydrogenase assembly protein HupF [Brenneria goodwinii]|uniref:Hydrogenase assembly protein HupF n=1 Tax=Brenneria goodwinii TaxID=1109412 RepID=A0A0G4K2C9_9GAMM|nr:HypC/HybG/HupF family hydrogenase formation chaperone [Brenneria goodwinii]ATA24530.1 hydrogenase assembly protein HupF [Brenneria goodwinii]MCG8157667.1 HypC/HybG/HupF family hydrogenase formation chaperone [Brenneria goodwinii]MCG8161092.1 HypC/HybG/HupF family hydrogenase formation chaperone [Brenneria goodwinii]MCG8165490.1 HypC/HybG/HupF family hydrogenase formation chaperone [Brenneria goodwinii]MCG8169973.1 HypC/HybG/HupF family hydrogenase formation chaperone [Brenneria goodwinii]